MEANQDVRSVQAFLQQVWEIKEQPDTTVNLYRGQLDRCTLLPKLFRSPNTVESVRKYEREMLDELRTAAPHLRPSEPANDWDWISLGQHYGMSTRMSDWSANPLIALFFAVEGHPKGEEQPVVYHYPILKDYVVDKNTSPFDIKHTRVMQVTTHSHRAAAQAAWQIIHAIHGMGNGYWQFLPLGEMPPHDERITPINVSKESVPSIRKELAHWGITPSTVFGEYGWVCRSIAPSYGLV